MKGEDERWPVKCTNPIDIKVLADYWLAALEGPVEEAVEEHLFDCDKCGDRLRELIALAEGVRDASGSDCDRSDDARNERRGTAGAPSC